MLKQKVADISTVPEKYRGLYTEGEDGIFILDSEVATDDSGLKDNNQKLLDEKRKIAQDKLNLQAQLDTLNSDKATAAEKLLVEQGKFDELLTQKQTTFDTQLQTANERADSAIMTLKKSLIDSAVKTLALELAGSERAALIEPHLANRVQVNEVDGTLTVQYTDINGTPTATSSDALITEFKNNEMFKPILNGRNSSGGGGDGGNGGGASDDAATWGPFFNPHTSTYDPGKQAELEAKNPEMYKQLSTKFGLDDPYSGVTSATGTPGNARQHY